MTSYIGNTPGLANRLLWRFTATASQTTFTGPDINNNNLNYASYVIDVYVNGVLTIRDTDYTSDSGNSIVFNSGLNVNDDVIIIGVGTFNIPDTYTRSEIDNIIRTRVVWRFVATAGQTVITGADFNSVTLDFTNYNIDVFVNGDLLTPVIDYTTSGDDTVTIADSLSVNDEVIIIGITLFNLANTYTKNEVDGLLNTAGGGFYKGNTGDSGNPTNGRGDIFRINSTELTANVTIANNENASVAGPLTIANNVVLTVEGNLVIL
jgi:hypothetical protein